MSPEAAQGNYVITAWTEKGQQISYRFDIREYVLPKYEVTVGLPHSITILDEEAQMKICAKYTYGKPVLGSVRAEFCRRGFRYFWSSVVSQNDICKKYELTTDKNGCATQTVNLTAFSLDKNMYDDSFEVEAEMEEYGTGVILKGRGVTTFTSHIRTVTFENVPAAYKPGIPFEGKVITVGMNFKAFSHLGHLEDFLWTLEHFLWEIIRDTNK
ncbi:hypothetical protein LDENG_00272460 [Lucifuga dentata]|nr:hypothetical protein LDENG_00272460 [Lucifuga dentata]